MKEKTIYDWSDEKGNDVIVLDKDNPPLSNNEKINKAVKMTLENIDNKDLQSSYRKKHEDEDCNPLFGHCFVATEVLWELLKKQNIIEYMPHNIQHEGISHWFLRHMKNGDIIDVTAGQFKTPVPYYRRGSNDKTGRRSSMMRTLETPTKRTIKVLKRIKNLEKILSEVN